MNLQKTPIAIAAFALFAVAPVGAQTAPSNLSFRQPTNGEAISGTVRGSDCEITGRNIRRVEFSIRPASGGSYTALNTDQDSAWQCTLDTTRFGNGRYTLRARAFDRDSGGSAATVTRTVNISNGTSGGGTGNTPPAVSISAPANGATVGTSVSYAANATDSNGIRQVQFFLDGSTTALRTDTSSPYSGSVTLAAGTHTLRAVATDNLGSTSSSDVTFSVQSSTGGGGTGGGTGPQVSITSPANGATVRGSISYAANASDSNGIRYVQFFLNNATSYLRNDTAAPFSGTLNTATLSDGTHRLRAVARARETGATSTTEVTFTVQNGTTGGGGTSNSAPSVNLTAPTSGTLSGTMTFAATASDTDGSVARVEFYLVNSSNQRTLIGSDTTNDYGGTYNTTQLANGSYQLLAVATDNANAQSTTQRAVTIDNVVQPTPTPTPEPTPDSGGGTAGATTLPANGAGAVATFESLGMSWRPGSNPGAAGCSLRYRKHSESTWREALPMWYDTRDSECRGSIVHLDPGTDYAVEMGVGTSFSAGVNTRTWAEDFPIARTVQVPSGSGTLNITEGGTPQGYVLYTGPATLDAADGADYNVAIDAPYVIVRGLTMRGARIDGIRISPAVTNVVIEDNDISGWGRSTGQTVNGVRTGVDRDSGIRANCNVSPGSLQRVIIQRNRIHDPRWGSNSWDGRIHPLGPVGIEISHCGGNHVIRYNEITSSAEHYFKDGMGGQQNFSRLGFPAADSDIHGNIVSHAMDDGIETDGGNRNVRIWGNYIDQTAAGISNTPVSVGPMYIFRNVYNRSRRHYLVGLDADDRLQFNKAGSQTEFGNGRRYVLHNTLLQATQAGAQNGLGAGNGIAGLSNAPMTNTVSRNNILHTWRAASASIATSGGTGNDLDYDLRNGNIAAYAGAEANGIVGTPVYRGGHGWSNWTGGNYQLDPSSPGYNRGARLPNFNDGFTGSAPDVGAHEGDTPAMRLGVNGGRQPYAGPAGTSTATASGTSTTGGTTTTSATADPSGVCSTALCVATQ